jgi:hypothetical protein
MMTLSSRWSTKTLGLIACALSIVACAEASAPTTVNSRDQGDDLDMQQDQGSGDLGVPDLPTSDLGPDLPVTNPDDMSPDAPPDEDMAPDAPLEVDYELCALLDPSDPFGACAPDLVLDYGMIWAAQPATRILRIQNSGQGSITLSGARVQGLAPSIQLSTWSAPPDPMRSPQGSPLEIAPGEFAFIEVTLTGGASLSDLSAFALEASLDTLTPPPETISVPLAGSLGGCAPGTVDCNMNPADGCEVNTANDPTNCGQCGRTCGFDNAAALCSSGQCALGPCAQGFDDCNMNPADGCEIDIFNRLADCGACGQSCDIANASETCAQGACTFSACSGTYRDCNMDTAADGCEIDIATDVANCGGCGQACDIPGANATCSAQQCVFAGCKANFYNLDGSAANGCEYACTFQSADDQPDNAFADANCDGIDGTVSRAIFVARDGSDSGNGSMASPYRTISKALSVAANASGLDHVYISDGTFNEQLFLVNGVSLFGGYERAFGWRRSNTAISRVSWDVPSQGRIVALQGTNLTLPTTIDHLLIEAGSATGGGTSVYGFYCRTCPGLRLLNNTILAGDAGRGIDGTPGTTPASRGYSPGSGGSNGQCDGDTPGNGGGAGGSDCGRSGGAGGRGGEIASSGTTGGIGAGGTPGGAGGGSGDPGRRGGNGSDGAAGAAGSSGSGGSNGQVQSDYWVGNDGASGGSGAGGNGGGGGGGGGGQGGCFPCNRGGGNGGGGGGGGGCGGSGGSGGIAGGSSFAVFLHSSTNAVLQGNIITAGAGGRGGDGANGGAGSLGADGAAGAQTCTGEVGGGGTGGRGGQGGQGGRGGGGAGGHSYGVYRHSTTIGLPGTNNITAGSAGQGGAGGNNGVVGTAATYK